MSEKVHARQPQTRDDGVGRGIEHGLRYHRSLAGYIARMGNAASERYLLAINVGNTHTNWAWMREGEVVGRAQALTAEVSKIQVKAWLLAGPVAAVFASDSEDGLPEGTALASVVPAVTRVFEEVMGECGVSLLVVSGENAPGLRVAVRKPALAGPDRVANALGLVGKYGAPAIAVDVGTATTLDVVDASGQFVGGAIALGPGSALRALHDYTARLPLVNFAFAASAIGCDTESAILAGAVLGHAGLIDGLVRRTRRELGQEAPAVLTGGLGSAMAQYCTEITVVDPELTLRGLYFAWENTRER